MTKKCNEGSSGRIHRREACVGSKKAAVFSALMAALSQPGVDWEVWDERPGTGCTHSGLQPT
jgi:hypothetical protein